MIFRNLLSALFICFSIISTSGQSETPDSPIIFIYDASGSMWGQSEGRTKMAIAAEVLANSVDRQPESRGIGLVVYGHRRKSDCTDVEFLVPVEAGSREQIRQALQEIRPLGKTPLAFSADLVIDQLRTRALKATVILITDGIESCEGDLCEVVGAAKAEGIDFKLHVIGFGLKEDETEQLICAAQAGDGQYFDAADAAGLTEVMQLATDADLEQPADNFTVLAVKNGAPVDAYVKVLKAGTDTSLSIARTYADTARLYLPAGSFDLQVTPLEGSDLKTVTLSDLRHKPGAALHRTVSFDAGKIKVTSLNNGDAWDAVVRIYASGSRESVAGGRTYAREDVYELNPGIYDVELQAMKVEGSGANKRIEKVTVEAGKETPLEHDFESGMLQVGAKDQAGLVDAVVKIVDLDTQVNVGGGRTYKTEASNPKTFLLSPGNYRVSLDALGALRGRKQTFDVTVKAGETASITAAF